MILSDEAVAIAFQSLEQKSRDRSYQDNPVAWAEDVLGLTLWSKQREILTSLVKNKKTAVKSSHAVGKTFISAVAACWWVSTREDAMVRSTAPTSYQVHELLWEEIRKLHARGNLQGEVNQKDVWKKPVYGVMSTVGSGQKPSDTNIHSFHGVHRVEGVLTILDEGCGIGKALYTAADAISTGKNDRVLVVGNPDDPQTPFGDIFLKPTQKLDGTEMWNKITVSAFDTPNFTGEEVPDVVKESLIQKDWVEERAQEWGVESGRYRSKILGEFPDQSDNSFFAQRVIDTGIETDIIEDYENPLKLGVDIAGGGEDETVVYGNRGGRIRKVDSWPEGDAVYTANRILEVATKNGAREIRIDAVGFGAAVVDIIGRDPRAGGFVVIAVKGSFMPKNNAAHANARAEHYDSFRFGLSQGLVDIDPHDTQLKDELLSIQYKLNDRGSIQIESKRDVRKRGDKSPDNLDAAIYSYIEIEDILDRQDKLGSMSAAEFLEVLPQWANLPW